MSIPGSASPLFFQTAAADAAAVGPTKSLRFDRAAGSNLSKTFGSTGDTKKFTWSFWFKGCIGQDGPSPFILGVETNNANRGGMYFSNETLRFYSRVSDTTHFDVYTDAVFRDLSSWYHCVLAVDVSKTFANGGIKIYINGVDQPLSSSLYTQNQALHWNTASPHAIGNRPGYTDRYFYGYMADIYFVDGQQLAATDFGAFDSNNVWQAAAYSGTFGTNGFHLLDFANESTIGHDSSGNNNDFTANNFSASALATGTVSGSGTPANASGSGGWAQAFDGSTSTLIYNSNGSTTTTFTLTDPIAWTSKIRIYAGQNGTSGTNISANGVNLSALVTWPLAGGWQEVTTHLTSPLTSLALTSVGGQSSNIRAVEIDNTVIVQGDAGDIDVLFDVPTNGTQSDTGAGGEVSGNYCTLNGLYHGSTMSNGNLDYVSGAANIKTVQAVGTIGVSSGKYYFEVTCTASSGSYTDTWFIGLVKSDFDEGTTVYNQSNNVLYYGENGNKYVNSSGSSYGASYTDDDIIGVAADLTGNTIEFFKNGSSQGSISYTFSGIYLPYISNGDDSSSVSATLNFGQRAFSYSAPSGYKTWNTASLPTPTIADGSKHFDITTFTGVGTSKTISGLGFSPDLLWMKSLSSASNHAIWDTTRGVSSNLTPNSTAAEGSVAITSFDSDGFTLGDSYNGVGLSLVAWTWDCGSSAVSNSDGDITSTVRVNQSAGQSIVTYTGNSSTNKTVGHGLNAAPEMIIIKCRNATSHWTVYHKTTGNNAFTTLNRTNLSSSLTGSGVMDTTSPTSSVFTVGDYSGTGDASRNFVAYCFAPVEGYSRMGSWSGNATSGTDQPFIWCGFRPRFIMWKKYAGQTDNWFIFDTARDTYNRAENWVNPNTTSVETSDVYNKVDILSNGFKMRVDNSSYGSNTSHDFLFYAVAENPFQANGGLAR